MTISSKWLKFIGFCGLFLSLCTAHAQRAYKAGDQGVATAACPTKSRLRPDFSMQSLKNLANRPEIKSVEDLVCCLSRDLELEFLNVHTSQAAQDSDSENPRTLMFAKTGNNKIHAIFSVNSGEAHLSQAQSVEMMYNANLNQQLSLFDIEFSNGRGHVSNANPTMCLGCHGIGGEMPKFGGPKTIFDRNPWQRINLTYANFSPQNDPDLHCPNRRAGHRRLEQRSEQAFQTKPRYNCLKHEKPADLDDIDFHMRKLNSRRVAKWIRATPDYERYKFVIMGAAYSCDFKNMEDWMPAEELAKLTKAETLLTQIRSARTNLDLETVEMTEDILRWKHNLIVDGQNTGLVEKMARGEPVHYQLPQVDGGRMCTMPYQVRDGEIDPAKDIRTQISERWKQDDTPILPVSLQQLYSADTEIRGGDWNMRIYRFLFEGRGLDISDWDTQPLPGYGRDPGNLRIELSIQEPKSSPDKELLMKAASLPQYSACELLPKLSRERFAQ